MSVCVCVCVCAYVLQDFTIRKGIEIFAIVVGFTRSVQVYLYYYLDIYAYVFIYFSSETNKLSNSNSIYETFHLYGKGTYLVVVLVVIIV